MLALPDPQVDVFTLRDVVECLRAYIHMIKEARMPEPEAPSIDPAEGTVMADLFATLDIPPPPPQEHA